MDKNRIPYAVFVPNPKPQVVRNEDQVYRITYTGTRISNQGFNECSFTISLNTQPIYVKTWPKPASIAEDSTVKVVQDKFTVQQGLLIQEFASLYTNNGIVNLEGYFDSADLSILATLEAGIPKTITFTSTYGVAKMQTTYVFYKYPVIEPIFWKASVYKIQTDVKNGSSPIVYHHVTASNTDGQYIGGKVWNQQLDQYLFFPQDMVLCNTFSSKLPSLPFYYNTAYQRRDQDFPVKGSYYVDLINQDWLDPSKTTAEGFRDISLQQKLNSASSWYIINHFVIRLQRLDSPPTPVPPIPPSPPIPPDPQNDDEDEGGFVIMLNMKGRTVIEHRKFGFYSKFVGSKYR